MTMHMNKCRSCLAEENLFDWTNLIVYDDESDNNETQIKPPLNYVECFRRCTQLDECGDDEERLPQQICYKCAALLRCAYLFIEKAHDSDSKLRWMLSETDTNEPENFEYVLLNSPQSTVAIDCENIDDDVLDDSPYIEEKRQPKYSRKIIKNPQLVVCENCGESVLETVLRTHMARRHKKEDTQLCHVCPRTLKDTRALFKHLLTHEKNRSRDFHCELCPLKFYTIGAFRLHKKTHEWNRKPKFQCDQCTKSFYYSGDLNIHKRVHDGDRIFQCSICSNRYQNQATLDHHLIRHSDNKPFKCPHCQMSFKKNSSRDKHVLVSHEGHRYKCDVCNKEFKAQLSLSHHRKEHTGYPLKCSLCSKGCPNLSRMRRHIRSLHKTQDPAQIDNFIVQVETKT